MPDGKKIKCPKCATVFVTPGAAPKPVSAIQEKPSFRPPPKQEPEDEGWEIVEDDEPTTAGQPAKVVEPFKMEDLPMAKPPDLFEDEQEDSAKSKRKQVTKKPARDYKKEEEEDDLDEEEPQPAARSKQPVRKPVRDDHEDEEEEDLDEEKPVVKRRQPVRKLARDDYDDEEDDRDFDDEDDDRSLRAGKRKKDSAGSAALFLLLIFGGVFLLLAAGGGLGAYLFVNRHKNHGPDDELLAYVPDDCPFLEGADISTLTGVSATMATEIEVYLKREINVGFVAECKKTTGYEFRDLFEYAVIANRSTRIAGPLPVTATRTILLKSKVPFNQNALRDAARGATPEKHEGKTFFKMNEAGASMMYMPSDRILILSNMNEGEMHAFVRRDGKTPALRPDALALVQKARDRNNWWALGVIDANARQGLQLLGTVPNVPPDVKVLLNHVAEAKGIEFSATFSGSPGLHLRCTCASDAGAQRLARDGEAMWNKNLKGLGGLGVAAFLATLTSNELRNACKEIINSARFGNQGSVAELTVPIGARSMELLLRELNKRSGNLAFGAP
ncbi:MAG TPA: hypothetical protein VKI17_12530 [Gemmataceae bacterium]|nr:hypothetical protein [Gemmataceae bacterium]